MNNHTIYDPKTKKPNTIEYKEFGERGNAITKVLAWIVWASVLSVLISKHEQITHFWKEVVSYVQKFSKSTDRDL